jgi:hypothetical protein
MPDYSKGKIYSIRSHQTDDIYIGSTVTTLSLRLSEHKSKYKHNILSSASRELLKYDDVYIELIEEYPCDNKEQLNKREGEHIRNNKCVNKVIAGRTQKEYNEEHKEEIKTWFTTYNRSEHRKQLMKGYSKKYREKIKSNLA